MTGYKYGTLASTKAVGWHALLHQKYHQHAIKLSWIHIGASLPLHSVLTHWGRVTHICVSKLAIIGSDNGLSPGRRQAIIWINAGILLIRSLGTNFSEILSEILVFSFKKMHLKMSSVKWRLLRLGLNVLTHRHISEYSLQMQVSPMPLLDDTYTYGSVYFLLMSRMCLHFAPILSRHFFQIVSNSEDVAICCPKWRRISLLILSKTSVFNGDNPSRPVRFEAASTSDPKYKSARRQLIPVAARSKRIVLQ